MWLAKVAVVEVEDGAVAVVTVVVDAEASVVIIITPARADLSLH